MVPHPPKLAAPYYNLAKKAVAEAGTIDEVKDLRDKAESYANQTIAALNDTVDDIKSVIEQAQARRMP